MKTRQARGSGIEARLVSKGWAAGEVHYERTHDKEGFFVCLTYFLERARHHIFLLVAGLEEAPVEIGCFPRGLDALAPRSAFLGADD